MSAEKTVLEVLREARDLLLPEGAWVQGQLAGYRLGDGDEDVVEVSYDSPEAQCFCALGAIYFIAGAEGSDISCRAERALANCIPEKYRMREDPEDWTPYELAPADSIPEFNDHYGTTKEQLIAAFDAAIAAEEARS